MFLHSVDSLIIYSYFIVIMIFFIANARKFFSRKWLFSKQGLHCFAHTQNSSKVYKVNFQLEKVKFDVDFFWEHLVGDSGSYANID